MIFYVVSFSLILIFSRYIGRLSLIYAENLRLLDFINLKKAKEHILATKMEKHIFEKFKNSYKSKQTVPSYLKKYLLLYLTSICYV